MYVMQNESMIFYVLQSTIFSNILWEQVHDVC